MNDPTIETIDVSALEFDPSNPRLPEALHNANDEDVMRFMMEEANIPELMMSIGQKGYFWGEPLLAVPSTLPGKYMVVEGNRRLTCLKLLQENIEPPMMGATVRTIRDQAKYKPNKVPTLIFERREDILSYLGYRHITGIKEWGALAKARYLRQLRESLDIQNLPNGEAHKILAKQIGSRSANVAKMLAGLSLLDRAESDGILSGLRLNREDIPFSLLTTGIGWESIASFIGLESPRDVDQAYVNTENLREFFSWTFFKQDGIKTRLGESRNFEKLARIVSSAPALAALRRGNSILVADTLTSGPLEALKANIQSAISSITNARSCLKFYPDIGEEDLSYASELEAEIIGLNASMQALLKRKENQRLRSELDAKRNLEDGTE